MLKEASPPLPDMSVKKSFALGALLPITGVGGMFKGELRVGEEDGEALAALPKML